MSARVRAFSVRVALGACSSHVGTLLRFQSHTPDTHRYGGIATLDLHAHKHVHGSDYRGFWNWIYTASIQLAVTLTWRQMVQIKVGFRCEMRLIVFVVARISLI